MLFYEGNQHWGGSPLHFGYFQKQKRYYTSTIGRFWPKRDKWATPESTWGDNFGAGLRSPLILLHPSVCISFFFTVATAEGPQPTCFPLRHGMRWFAAGALGVALLSVLARLSLSKLGGGEVCGRSESPRNRASLKPEGNPSRLLFKEGGTPWGGQGVGHFRPGRGGRVLEWAVI